LIEAGKSSQADFLYRIFNADGSEVAQCGNGARCVARFLQEEKLTHKNFIIVETLAGLLELKLESKGDVTVNLGIPSFEPSNIPMLAEKQQALYAVILDNQPIEFCALSIGNPHCVLIIADNKKAPVSTVGPLLMKHPYFPQQTNVAFMEIVDEHHIRLRVYERGAGETLACGSGAAAAVAAGYSLNRLANAVTVEQLGGLVTVRWQGPGEPIYLTGPVTTVFKGVLL
jgi:diaminopimelate epimerase